MRPLLWLLLLVPLAAATPPEPPPERFAVEIVRAPAAGEWGELRATHWRTDGSDAPTRVSLRLPGWVAIAGSPEWEARPPPGGETTRSWLVRPEREGLWSAQVGWSPVVVAWAATESGGSYDALPAVLQTRREMEVLADGRVRLVLETAPAGAWVNGTLVAWLRPVGDAYDGSEDRVEAPLGRVRSLSVVVAPNASGRVSVQEGLEPRLSFDGPAEGTPYFVQQESTTRVYEIADGGVHEVDAYGMEAEAVPALADAPSGRAVPGPGPGLAGLALALAVRRAQGARRATWVS